MGVDACFVFGFVVFYLWVNSDNIVRWQTRHAGSFQILCLGSCPLSPTNRKILLISLAKYAILASLIRRPIFLICTGSSGFGFKVIIFVFRKSMQILFTARVLPTIRRMDQILEGTSITVALSRPKITVAYTFITSRFRPSLTGLIRLRWHWVCR